jgi:hypothetical protein
VWIAGPTLIYTRQLLACAMIRKDDQNPSKSLIAAGGEQNLQSGLLDTVEILDEGL